MFNKYFLSLTSIPVFTLYLSYWQVKRLNWKLNLIDDLNEKLSYDSIELPKKINLENLKNFDYFKFNLNGHFNKNFIFLRPRTYDNSIGVNVIQPFERKKDKGSTVLVNRGFVKNENIDDFMKNNENNHSQSQSLTCFLKPHPTKNIFTPENKPETNHWFWLDLDTISNHFKSLTNDQNLQPVLLDSINYENNGKTKQNLSTGTPVGCSPVIELRNQHAVYAITWFSLSILTSGLLYKLNKSTRNFKLMKNK